MNFINWNAIERTGKSLAQHRQIWLTKHISRYNAVGRQMLQRKEWNNSNCPRCNQKDEDSDHVITCPCKDASNKFSDLTLELIKKLENIKTCPIIIESITMTLFDGKKGLFLKHLPPPTDDMDNKVYKIIQKAAKEQDEIGWINTLEGKLSKTWEIAQAHHYNSLSKCQQ